MARESWNAPYKRRVEKPASAWYNLVTGCHATKRSGKEAMNGFFLLIPFLLVRFGLLSALDRRAIGRAAHFAPMAGRERIAYWVYQLANAAIFVYLCFLRVRIEAAWPFYAGLAGYACGLVLCAASMADFAAPSEAGFSSGGLYRFSRNPMYVSYFLIFAGCALLTRSLALFAMVFVFQAAAHWIILAEERWCVGQFGEAYRRYMRAVRRYI